MFNNARTYNEPGSQIVESANHLERVFDQKLYFSAVDSDLPGAESVCAGYVPFTPTSTP